jgi:hypothetical protein
MDQRFSSGCTVRVAAGAVVVGLSADAAEAVPVVVGTVAEGAGRMRV